MVHLFANKKTAKIKSVIDIKDTLQNWHSKLCLFLSQIWMGILLYHSKKTILFYDFRCHNLNPKDTLQKNWALTLKKLPQAMYFAASFNVLFDSRLLEL